MTCDFSITSRSLTEILRWKATEYRILLTPNIDITLINFTEKLFTYFLTITVNMDLWITVNIDTCSCFPFENYLKSLKTMVRKFEKPLEQVVKSYGEFLTFTEPKIISLDNKEIVSNYYIGFKCGEKISIAVVENLSNTYIIFNIQEIKLNKYVILNDPDNLKIAIPILHSNREF
ncbi:Uncharacterized protein FWK35_00018513 [Aphis craccivora]|uniref:Uncharacterized protein n=1 Tax=Aphis craccivora TaxID=307492 RepID=A0A6G0XAN1_APHCR|nr:Uncharacterized protein FWK35_00018513 [Aphis craccivora]